LTEQQLLLYSQIKEISIEKFKQSIDFYKVEFNFQNLL